MSVKDVHGLNGTLPIQIETRDLGVGGEVKVCVQCLCNTLNELLANTILQQLFGVNLESDPNTSTA